MSPTKRVALATLVASAILQASSQAGAATWVRNVVPGPKAIYIGVDGAANGTMPSIMDAQGNIYQYDGTTWQPITGHTGASLAVDWQSFPWITETSGQIWSWEYGWTNDSHGGCATWVAAGVSNQWVIGCSWLGAGGYGIYHLENNAWKPKSGQAVQISVSIWDVSDTPWLINAQNHVFVQKGTGWQDVTAGLPYNCAQSIAALSSTSAYVTSCNGAPTGNGYYIYKYSNGTWQQISNSSDVYIAIGGSTDIVPWSVDGVGTIYQWTCPVYRGC
jgi:hypothetical protein